MLTEKREEGTGEGGAVQREKTRKAEDRGMEDGIRRCECKCKCNNFSPDYDYDYAARTMPSHPMPDEKSVWQAVTGRGAVTHCTLHTDGRCLLAAATSSLGAVVRESCLLQACRLQLWPLIVIGMLLLPMQSQQHAGSHRRRVREPTIHHHPRPPRPHYMLSAHARRCVLQTFAKIMALAPTALAE